ncbi:MAG: hypothetical protein IPL32_13670 [Chloracidobacterium sp.]|nr:hypothetical protein [Chloracidobacterium sp.]
MDDSTPQGIHPEFIVLLNRSETVLAELKKMNDGPKPIDTARYVRLKNELREIADQMELLMPGHKT